MQKFILLLITSFEISLNLAVRGKQRCLQVVFISQQNGNNMAMGTVSVKLDNVTEINTFILTKNIVLFICIIFIFSKIVSQVIIIIKHEVYLTNIVADFRIQELKFRKYTDDV